MQLKYPFLDLKPVNAPFEDELKKAYLNFAKRAYKSIINVYLSPFLIFSNISPMLYLLITHDKCMLHQTYL